MSRLPGVALLLALAGLAGCGLIAGSQGDAAVTIPLGAARQAAPLGVESFSVAVDGPGMEPLSDKYPADTESVTIVVPAGPRRRFSVEASADASAPPTMLGYAGSAVEDLTAGVDATVQIRMRRRTTLVVPDNVNGRLVQIDSLSGAGWQEGPTPPEPGPPLVPLRPWAVDFDDQGRMYVIEDDGNYNGIIRRMDDIHGANAVLMVDDAESFPRALAVDSTAGVIYYYAQNYGSIQKHVITDPPGGNGTLGYNPAGNVRGMDADGAGFLYVAVDEGGGASSVVKVDLSTESAVASRPYTGQLAMDVLAKDGSVYVAVRDPAIPPGGTLHRIEELAPDLTPIAALTNADVGGAMIGPLRFVSPLNGKITLMEENATTGTDQLVGLDDISGAGFATYGTSGAGTGQFEFFVDSSF